MLVNLSHKGIFIFVISLINYFCSVVGNKSLKTCFFFCSQTIHCLLGLKKSHLKSFCSDSCRRLDLQPWVYLPKTQSLKEPGTFRNFALELDSLLLEWTLISHDLQPASMTANGLHILFHSPVALSMLHKSHVLLINVYTVYKQCLF